MKIGKLIEILRESRTTLSKTGMARELGISQPSITFMELYGKDTVGTSRLEEICKVLNIKVSTFFQLRESNLPDDALERFIKINGRKDLDLNLHLVSGIDKQELNCRIKNEVDDFVSTLISVIAGYK